MSSELVDDELVVEIARSAVRELGAQGMPLFRANSEGYLKNPDGLVRRQSGDQVLGFGAGIDVTLLTPAALAIAAEVVRFVTSEIAAAAKDQSRPLIQALVRRVFARLQPGSETMAAAEPAP